MFRSRPFTAIHSCCQASSVGSAGLRKGRGLQAPRGSPISSAGQHPKKTGTPFSTRSSSHLNPTIQAPRRPSTASAAAASPAYINKIQSRTALIARHLSVPTPSSVKQPSSSTSSHSTMAPTYGIRSVAAPHTLEHRTYIEKDGQPCSPFHDIPLYANEQQTILNMVVEIPRWTNAKQEVSGGCSRSIVHQLWSCDKSRANEYTWLTSTP